MLLICYGTRPEWLKIKPIVEKLRVGEYTLLFTGQHRQLTNGMPFDIQVKISDEGRNRLDDIVAQVLSQFPDGHNSVLVQGDTASAFACALAGFHRGMNVVHLEAGLRTNDIQNPYPEEAYRQMISRITTHHLCPTEQASNNLTIDNVVSDNRYVIGNTSLDNIVTYKHRVIDQQKVLVTLHRRENHDIIDKWFTAINELAHQHTDLEFVLPIHPNPNVMKWKDLLTHVRVVNPLEHKDLLNVMCATSLIITDSGGIQEEASFLGKKVIVARETTERMEGVVSGHLFLCKSPDILKDMFTSVLDLPSPTNPCPFGDGHSADRAISIIRGLM